MKTKTIFIPLSITALTVLTYSLSAMSDKKDTGSSSGHVRIVPDCVTPAEALLQMWKFHTVATEEEEFRNPAKLVHLARFLQGGPTLEIAEQALADAKGRKAYVDYFEGVAIKTDFENFPVLDLKLYFRDHSTDFVFKSN